MWTSLTYLIVCLVSVEARNRVYYLAAEEMEWNYAPGGKNLVDDRQEDADVFLKQGPDRIGGTYTKCIYKRYRDISFTREVPKPSWMGILGPALSGEVGDTMTIHFRNRCSRPFSVHPHGVKYDKGQEGAVYVDGTSGTDKLDDSVSPGGRHTYTWEIPPSFAPAADDPTCISWVYHSHVNAVKDANSGLIGLLLTCKPGSLKADNTRIDGQKDYALLFKIFNEEVSWYYESNFNKCGNPSACQALADNGDEDFAESNLLHAINGKLYGNLPHFTACENEVINWHLLGMGTEVDLHTALVHGQTLIYNKHRTVSVGLFAAEFKTAVMIPQQKGRWLINCQVNDHYTAGMQAFLDVAQCWSRKSPVPIRHRLYHIAAEEVLWNYAPSGLDGFNGGNLTESGKDSKIYYETGSYRIGGVYKKAVYIEYTNGSFKQKKTRSVAESHLGFLGPVIRAEVGERIIVVFKNLASRPYSMQANGVRVGKDEEGSKYNDGNLAVNAADDEVQPGGIYVYIWDAPVRTGPTPLDPDCITDFYQSGVDPVRDTNSGLIGPILVCKKGTLKPNGKQKYINKEFVLMFTITDENLSWYIEENKQRAAPGLENADDEDFVESNKMRNINGRGYGNLMGLEFDRKSRVSWHLIGLGTESDLHAVHFHGNTLIKDGGRADSIALFPGTTATAIMNAENEGVWGIVSRTNLNFLGGMTALYRVQPNGLDNRFIKPTSGLTRTFYIGVVERLWDYAPLKRDIIVGKSLYDPESDGFIFVRNDTQFIGSTYKKAIYRQFTDGTFTTEVPRTEEEKHLGLMGPYIRAEVGDVIKVVFKNMADRPFSLHPHGIVTDKGNEGALYPGAGSPSPGDSVRSGGQVIYVWKVSKKAGPALGDPNCIAWPYYSHVDPVRDVHSGLIGPLIICKKGVLNRQSKRIDKIDREFTLLFTVTNENLSWYIDENIRNFAPARTDRDDPDFEESNLMHGINGRIYGNNNGIEMNNGEVAAWYVIGMGTEIDIHTVHFHGQTLIHKQQVVTRVDVIEVFPGISETLEMRADNLGTWLLHCHISDHLLAGMETVFTIKDGSVKTTTDHPNVITTAAPLPSVCHNGAVWVYLRKSNLAKANLLWTALCSPAASAQARARCTNDRRCKKTMDGFLKLSSNGFRQTVSF